MALFTAQTRPRTASASRCLSGIATAAAALSVLLGAGIARADGARFAELEGRRVEVTMKNRTIVRAWLIRVRPKKLLLGCDGKWFMRVAVDMVVQVRRISSAASSWCISIPSQSPRGAPRRPVIVSSGPIHGGSPRGLESLADNLREKALRSFGQTSWNVGIGLTFSGLGVFGAGWLSAILNPSAVSYIVGGLIVGSGLGGIATAAGNVLWVVGAVRRSIARAERIGGVKDREATRKRWLRAGIGVTIASLIVAAVGGGMLGVKNLEGGMLAGGCLLTTIGGHGFLFVGLPMWIEASRYGKAKSELTLAPRGKPRNDRHLGIDPVVAQYRTRSLPSRMPQPMVLSMQLSF